jgi:hypothetical protein
LAGFVGVELLFEACEQIQYFPGRGHELTLARGLGTDKCGICFSASLSVIVKFGLPWNGERPIFVL